jgi:hypothetical protein
LKGASGQTHFTATVYPVDVLLIDGIPLFIAGAYGLDQVA